jgi:polysaccharide pyruvyl transferase CsaB
MAGPLAPSRRQTCRVLVSGYYGMANLGDEAILTAILAAFRGALGESFVPVVATYDAGVTHHFHGPVETVPARSLQELADAIRASDLVVWGGGGLLQDRWHVPAEEMLRDPQGGIPWYLRTPFLATALGVPCIAYGQGIGPIEHEENRRLVGLVMNGVDAVTVRDPLSRALLDVCGVHLPPVEVTADPVVSLQPAAPERGEELLRNIGLDPARRPILAVAPRVPPPPGRPGWEAALRGALASWLEETQGSVALVVFDHSENGDERLCAQLRDGLGASGPVKVASEWLGAQDVAALLGACEAVLAMRLHALLLAAITATPTVALEVDPKLGAAVQCLHGAAPLVPLESLNAEEIRQALAQVREHRVEHRRELAAAVAELRVHERRNIEIAVGLLHEAAVPERRAARSKEREARLAEQVLEGERRAVELANALDRAVREHERVAAALRSQLATEAGARREAERREHAGTLALRNSEESLRTAETALAQRTAELAVLARDQDAAAATLAEVQGDRDRLLQQSQALAKDLAVLRSSLGVQVVLRSWSFLARHFPDQGLARRALRAVLRGFRRLLGRPSPAPAAAPPPDSGAAARPARCAADELVDLARFAEGCNARRVPMVVTVVSGTPLAEDEGQRPTQLALELCRRGIPVVFAHFRWWSTEWATQDRLENGLFQIPLDIVAGAPERLTEAFRAPRRVLLMEFPHPSMFALISAADAAGWITAYDVLDDWEEFHRGGQAVWYESRAERHLLAVADAVFAVNPALAGRVAELGRAEVEIVPNGLKPGIERVSAARHLQRGEVTVGYFGYLASAWFDWQLLAGAARVRPGWRFYLIGYGGEDHRDGLPANVTLLGKQPQRDLASYAANWDAAVVPFREGKLAAGADPIKVYEYLAMGLPVVVTGVSPPLGAEGLVTQASGAEDVVRALGEAARRRPELAPRCREFAGSCRWESRVDAMLATLTGTHRRLAVKRRLFDGVA